MTANSQRRNTFILRIWREDGESERNSRLWRGWIQSVHSGEETYIQDLDELIHFIEHHVGSLRDVRIERLR